MGHVYLITNDYHHFKIGITAGAIEKRLKQLQTGNSEKIELVKSYKSEHHRTIESWLHKKYFNQRLEGEWFQLTDDDVMLFEDTCQSIETTVKFLKEENYFFKKRDNAQTNPK